MTAPAVDFPIVWVEADDPELTWERDDMHMPFAVAPLSADYIQVLTDGMRYGRTKVGNPWHLHVRFWNGYVYMTARADRPVVDEDEAERAVAENQRALIPTAAAYWHERAMPELRASVLDLTLLLGRAPGFPEGCLSETAHLPSTRFPACPSTSSFLQWPRYRGTGASSFTR